MAERKILFICEGNKDEPRFLKTLMKKAFPFLEYSVYSYQTNIHILASRLEEDYPDFDPVRLCADSIFCDVEKAGKAGK